METNNMGTDVRIRDSYKDVNGIRIRYSVKNTFGEPVELVEVFFLKDELQFGSMSVERNGKMHVIITKPNVLTTYAAQSEVIDQALSDAFKYFDE